MAAYGFNVHVETIHRIEVEGGSAAEAARAVYRMCLDGFHDLGGGADVLQVEVWDDDGTQVAEVNMWGGGWTSFED